MKKITISVIAATMIITNDAKAGLMGDLWDGAKEKTNKILIATHIKNEHMVNMDFEHIYPKEFYKKSYFGWVVTGVAVVGAGAFTYFSGGAGAPAAATGVSTVASWAAGGGAGSYMAGLSMIGSWFGGNAVLGAAILNGLSIGALGGGLGAKIATMGILAKVGMGMSVTALGLDGIAYFKNKETGQLEYRVRLVIPKNLGSKEIRTLVDRIYDANEKIQEAIEEGSGWKQKEAFNELNKYKEDAVRKLRFKLANGNWDFEDLLALSTIANNEAEYGLFDDALSRMNRSKVKSMGFLYYLDALNYLYHGNEHQALLSLQNSIDENKYALEPIALSINLLGYGNFVQNESKIEELAEFAKNNFDSDDYATPLSLVSIFYRVGTLYFINGRYVKAQQYYQKAKDELGFLQKHYFGKQLLHTIELSIANSMYKSGRSNDAFQLYNNIVKDIDTEDQEGRNERKKIEKQFIGNRS